jgi:tellurite resistance protein TehA-like permease
MLVAGLLAQGVGFIVSVLMFAAYIRRMIQYGLPSPSARPGMFISVGPPSFTILVLIGLARNYPKDVTYFGANELTKQVLMIMSTFTGIFLWGLSFWFFAISLIAVLVCTRQLTFHLNWWAFVFPNVGFTIATIDIGEVLQSEGIQWVGSGMSIIIAAVYLFVGTNHIRALVKREILWPGNDEDVHVDQRLMKREKQELYRRRSEEIGSMLNRTEEEQAEALDDMRHME